ncbi:MAG: hypothetical protein ACI857_002180, partial [Arenicella sp.]
EALRQIIKDVLSFKNLHLSSLKIINDEKGTFVFGIIFQLFFLLDKTLKMADIYLMWHLLNGTVDLWELYAQSILREILLL